MPCSTDALKTFAHLPTERRIWPFRKQNMYRPYLHFLQGRYMFCSRKGQHFPLCSLPSALLQIIIIFGILSNAAPIPTSHSLPTHTDALASCTTTSWMINDSTNERMNKWTNQQLAAMNQRLREWFSAHWVKETMDVMRWDEMRWHEWNEWN